MPSSKLIIFSSELNNALQKLGMNDAFNPGKADLTGMRKEGNIYISKVIQKFYLKVDENGAEVAVDNTVIIKIRSIIKKINVNRSFVVILKREDLSVNNYKLKLKNIIK